MVINEIYLRNDHQFGDNFLLALLEAVTKLSKVSATHAANFGQHDSCAQLVSIVQRFCGNNLNIQTMAAIAFTSLLPLNQKANNKQLGIPCCQFIVNSLLPFTTPQGVAQFKQVVASGQTAIVFGLTWKMMEAMLVKQRICVVVELVNILENYHNDKLFFFFFLDFIDVFPMYICSIRSYCRICVKAETTSCILFFI